MTKDLKGNAPKYGLDCSDEYVDSYKESHLKPVSGEYRIDYISLLIIDWLYRGYSLLDVGCGTAGYFRLLKNYKSLHGLDYSNKMLKAADELSGLYNLKNIKWTCSSFGDFITSDKFDVVRLGVYGTYEPITKDIINKVYGLLNKGGMAVFSIHPPKNYKERIKILLKKEKIKISNKSFTKYLLKNSKFKICMEIKRGRQFIFFCKK
jgi:ubiquinone/menaquinone biosynthesis C-methylase UbiE